MVDKNLFPYQLAVVAIMKCEGAYLKEWLDYHLLAGVDHFYLYDNDSPDNQAEVAKPYVDAGLVTYVPFPGKAMQFPAYNDAVKRFKFQCRYMAFVDLDEFVYPKANTVNGGGLIELVDELLSQDPYATGLSANWCLFGSNGHEKADYSRRGVLERFTRRATNPNRHVKTISNPRRIYIAEPHSSPYLARHFHSIYEDGTVLTGGKAMGNKIVINHYHCKSWEEYSLRNARGDVVINFDTNKYNRDAFKRLDCNDVFDDGILKYREARTKVYQPPNETLIIRRVLTALEATLSPTLSPDTPQDFYIGNLETFLICRAASSWLKDKIEDKAKAAFWEEASLKAITKSLSKGLSLLDKRLFLRELPNLVTLPYPVINDFRAAAIPVVSERENYFVTKFEKLLFKIMIKTLSGELTLEEKMSFIKELAELLELPPDLSVKDMRTAELNLIQARSVDCVVKHAWGDNTKVWNDYVVLNYIHDLLDFDELKPASNRPIPLNYFQDALLNYPVEFGYRQDLLKCKE